MVFSRPREAKGELAISALQTAHQKVVSAPNLDPTYAQIDPHRGSAEADLDHRGLGDQSVQFCLR